MTMNEMDNKAPTVEANIKETKHVAGAKIVGGNGLPPCPKW